MKFIDKLILVLTPPQKVPQGTDAAKQQSDRRMVMRTHGNVRLHAGQYVTEPRIEEQRQRTKSYDFG